MSPSQAHLDLVSATFLRCPACGAEGDVDLSGLIGRHGLLACPGCGRPIRSVNVHEWCEWIEDRVRHKRTRQFAGTLRSRKQSSRQSDEEIDRDGLAAELAACLMLCPGSVRQWCGTVERDEPNRGRDLLPEWTGLDKPVEVKQTRYYDSRRGYLLIRPPRGTPGTMRPEYVDDAYYVLLCGSPFEYTWVGWIDRDTLLTRGRSNPVPVRPGQRECWGVHWSKLLPPDHLMSASQQASWKQPEPVARHWESLVACFEKLMRWLRRVAWSGPRS